MFKTKKSVRLEVNKRVSKNVSLLFFSFIDWGRVIGFGGEWDNFLAFFSCRCNLFIKTMQRQKWNQIDVEDTLETNSTKRPLSDIAWRDTLFLSFFADTRIDTWKPIAIQWRVTTNNGLLEAFQIPHLIPLPDRERAPRNIVSSRGQSASRCHTLFDHAWPTARFFHLKLKRKCPRHTIYYTAAKPTWPFSTSCILRLTTLPIFFNSQIKIFQNHTAMALLLEHSYPGKNDTTFCLS